MLCFFQTFRKIKINIRKDFQMKNYAFKQATGTIDFTLTNDYMFRAVLERNQKVLKALICSLLHLEPSIIRSVEITNPITLGDCKEDKDFILDIHVALNDDTDINLEMQVKRQSYWTERSLSYLCRTFDRLTEGENYDEAKAAIHIGILDFTPFPDIPEFYASHKLMNVKNHHIYSSKFILNVLDLTQIDIATEEDKAYRIDYWARLFKAQTWEDIKMVAEKDENLCEASESLYMLNTDDITRQKCRARQEQLIREEKMKRKINTLTSENATLTYENETLTQENEALKKLLEANNISY